MKNKAINPINSFSPFFGAAGLLLTFVLTLIPIDTAQAQQSAAGHEGAGSPAFGDAVKARESARQRTEPNVGNTSNTNA